MLLRLSLAVDKHALCIVINFNIGRCNRHWFFSKVRNRRILHLLCATIQTLNAKWIHHAIISTRCYWWVNRGARATFFAQKAVQRKNVTTLLRPRTLPRVSYISTNEMTFFATSVRGAFRHSFERFSDLLGMLQVILVTFLNYNRSLTLVMTSDGDINNLFFSACFLGRQSLPAKLLGSCLIGSV